jgi:predicted TIM-barrel fold metal-dependent hydrolase
MKIIDAHHHFWSVSSGNYSWLEMSDPEMLWGKPSDLPREYFPADLLASTGDLELVKSVHVQCGFNPEYSAHESKWLQSLADAPGSHGFPHAIVGYADFSTSNVEELLSQHCQYKNVRGIRQILNRHDKELWNMSDRDYLKDENWRKNFQLLETFNLSFDLQLYYHQVDEAISLAKDNPNILFILNHAGMPADRDKDSIDAWRSAMHRLAACPNMVAKISGLGMCDKQWTTDSIRPYVIDVHEAFGVDRCMFASNFPVDILFSDYQTVWNAYDAITSEFSEDERANLFHDNAENYYRI